MEQMCYLYERDAQIGPFAISEVRAMAAERKISREALYWHPGMEDWKPLDSLKVFVPVPPKKKEEYFFGEDEFAVFQMGYFQRRMYQAFGLVFLVGTVGNFIFHFIPAGLVVFGLVDLFGLIYVVYCFLRFQALLVGWPLAIGVFFIISFIPVLIPLRLIFSAVVAYRKFKQYELRTDWLGLSPEELRKLKP
jgi:hypothetical protein